MAEEANEQIQDQTSFSRGGRRNENPHPERDRKNKDAGGRNRNGRGGKDAGGGKGLGREVLISKALSKLLRHAAQEAGIELDSEGFARLDEVVSMKTLWLYCSYNALRFLAISGMFILRYMCLNPSLIFIVFPMSMEDYREFSSLS